ncbi:MULTISPECIES: putative protein N(5)-glutamine methyltransferase [unclassified Pseudonocardia]|uniref:putative protein N(5)-glutamine methyltransferase n=1 Tax=unclassified Pseudonocardia TaxID=2619320 RepID=UPI0001FFF1C2|nr:putative protein N(5)-glutamine methyltransferase [Pseudonocardia sp. Ae707_Ps1]OLM16617.1 Protein-N(5)-glutamine methyltransferase PrmC [Pseudonocardia sp. Ae707_Ps1]
MSDLVARLRAAGCVFAEDEARLLAEAAAGTELDDLVRRRVAGEPLEHVLGWAAFDGARVRVAPGVFVPRRRTEALVHAAVAGLGPGAVVVDLCCGCGAVGAAIARRVPVELHAADVDPVATACAATNLDGLGTVHTGDLFAALPATLRGRVAVLVANTPYVPAGAIAGMPPEARDHEPRVALDGGGDGLDPARRIAAGAPGWLAPGGTLLIETSAAQAPLLADVFAGHGLEAGTGHDDDRDATWVSGRLPS